MSTTVNSLRVRALPALLLMALAPLPSQALTPAEVFAKVSPSVWHVRTYDRDGLRYRQGSAVVVDRHTVVTNCHVLVYASRIMLSQGKTRVPATLRLWDTERDVCELKATQIDSPAVTLADVKKLAVGQPVYAIGSPLGLENTLSNGLLSSLRKSDDGALKLIQTSAPISPGSSGGGLFDDQGRLVGLTTLTYGDKTAQNLNFAVPSTFWLELPERHAAALKAAPDSKVARAAKALEAPAPTVAFNPAVTMPQNPDKWQRTMTDRVPYLSQADQARFTRDYRALPLPRAFVISDNGASGMASGPEGTTPDLQGDAQERAMKLCQRSAGKPCVVYAIDNEVLFQPPPGAKP